MSSWSSCNFTRQIYPNECIGDSLATINYNFSALDVGVCSVPDAVPGHGTDVTYEVTEQKHNLFSLSTKNSYQYITDFESTTLVQLSTAELRDGTLIKSYKFPYIDSITSYKPQITFATTALTERPPKVTLCWMASGADHTTVYALNSATSLTNKGPIWPNGNITALHLSGDRLYVGGDFTEIGGNTARKFCEINLRGGQYHPSLKAIGSLASVPFADVTGDLGPIGSVNTIDYDERFLVVGGSFQGGLRGRGLCILDKSTGAIFPFYVNGSVNSVKVIKGINTFGELDGDNILYVGGEFDFVNYGSAPASEESNLRQRANGLFCVFLNAMTLNPFGSIEGYTEFFTGPATINTIEHYDERVFFGGNFSIKDGETLICKNLCSVRKTEFPFILSEDWKPITNGPVHSIKVDDTTAESGADVYLYIGGKFNQYYDETQFNRIPRANDEEGKCHNAICFEINDDGIISLQKYWKPKFNGPVFQFALENNNSDGHIYCYGNFNIVNADHQSYLCCVKKSSATFNSSIGETVYWRPSLQTGPTFNSKALLAYDDTLIAGGTFSAVNKSTRHNLARVNTVLTSQELPSLSSVHWDFECKIVSPGMDYTMPLTELTRVSAIPLPFGTINYTTLPLSPETLKHKNVEGQLLRFLVRRAGNTNFFGNLGSAADTLRRTVDVLGVKVDFN